MVHAVPSIEECQAPKTDDGKVIGMDGAADDLGDQVINGGEADWGEPEAEDVVGEPPVDRRLGRCLDGGEDQEAMGGEIECGEPEKGRHDIPLGDVDVPWRTTADEAYGLQRDEGKADEQEGRCVGGVFQPFHGGGVSAEDAPSSYGVAHVPEHGCQRERTAIADGSAAEAGEDPKPDANTGGGKPAVSDDVQVGGADSPEGEPRIFCEKLGIVQLDGGGDGQGGTEQKPEERTTKKDADRPAGRAVDLQALEAAFLDGGGIGVEGVFRTHELRVIEGSVGIPMGSSASKMDSAADSRFSNCWWVAAQEKAKTVPMLPRSMMIRTTVTAMSMERAGAEI